MGPITEYRPDSLGSRGDDGDDSCLGEAVPVSNKSLSPSIKEADMDVTQDNQRSKVATTETTKDEEHSRHPH